MSEDFIGKRIKDIRTITDQEAEGLPFWDLGHHPITVIELEDGSLIYPSRDEEGNAPGELFAKDSKDVTIILRGE